MKTKITIIAFLLINLVNAQAQNEKVKHFEIDVLANFWTPLSAHMKSTNSISQTKIDSVYYKTESFGGYGNSISPVLYLTYYFNEKIGFSFSFCPIFLNNELYAETSDTTHIRYHNSGVIVNTTLGLTGKIYNSSNILIYYGFGIDFIPNYNLGKTIATDNYYYHVEASDVTIGGYFNSGAQIKLTKLLKIKTGIEYSFIPTEIWYSNHDGTYEDVKTNLGSLSMNIGLSFNF